MHVDEYRFSQLHQFLICETFLPSVESSLIQVIYSPQQGCFCFLAADANVKL